MACRRGVDGDDISRPLILNPHATVSAPRLRRRCRRPCRVHRRRGLRSHGALRRRFPGWSSREPWRRSSGCPSRLDRISRCEEHGVGGRPRLRGGGNRRGQYAVESSGSAAEPSARWRRRACGPQTAYALHPAAPSLTSDRARTNLRAGTSPRNEGMRSSPIGGCTQDTALRWKTCSRRSHTLGTIAPAIRCRHSTNGSRASAATHRAGTEFG
nr:unknown [uncultured bacterium]